MKIIIWNGKKENAMLDFCKMNKKTGNDFMSPLYMWRASYNVYLQPRLTWQGITKVKQNKGYICLKSEFVQGV